MTVSVVPPPRTLPDGRTVTYAADGEPCEACGGQAWTRVGGVVLHTNRCLTLWDAARPSTTECVAATAESKVL